MVGRSKQNVAPPIGIWVVVMVEKEGSKAADRAVVGLQHTLYSLVAPIVLQKYKFL